MAIYFVSDFHLGERDRDRDQRKLELFDKFLSNISSDLSHLIILGDLYDFWFEYRYLIPKHNLSILFRLRDLVKSGVRVTYICGNHDFWIGDFMQSELGFEVEMDQLVLDTPRGKVLALHGDGIAPSDYKYRLLKRVLRNRAGIALYRQLPTTIAYKLALAVSGGSRHYGEQKPSDKFVSEYHDFARQKFSEGYHAIICGHIHWPELVDIGGNFYINCGDWLNYFSYVRLDNGKFELSAMI
ncbi:MAG: UDP-2,3-diacylglucosamine diphosphatase [bacterium]|nr:UDP-2,3-diacylglucosamine diphosphatase [bacterium]